MKVFDNLEAYAAEVGNEIGVSEWMVIDQDRINKFAEATGDLAVVDNVILVVVTSLDGQAELFSFCKNFRILHFLSLV